MPTASPKSPHLKATLFLACLAQFMVILDVSVVNVALPSIRHALKFSEADLQWVVNAYTVTFAGFLLLGGRAADLLGRQRVFVAGLILFALASLFGGVSDSQTMLIAARAAQGLGGAVIAPASLSILTTTFAEGSERNRALGIWGAMGAAGGSAGAVLGGILTDALSWRWILFINVPIGLLAAVATVYYISESRNENATRHFDLAGAVSATLGLTLLVLGIVNTTVDGWGSSKTLVLIAAGVVLLAVFVLIEGKFARAPLMPLRIYRSRLLSAANGAVLLMGAAMFAMWFFVSLYLQEVLGYSPLKAGIAFLPMTVAIAACAMITSRIVLRIGAKPPMLFGMISAAVGLLWFANVPVADHYVSSVLGPSILVAIGFGTAFVPATIAGTAGVAPQEAGLASGLINTSRLFGGALGLAVLAALATARTNSHHAVTALAVKHALTSGFHLAFVVAGGLSLVAGLVVVIAIPKLPARKPAPEPPAEPAGLQGAQVESA
jgi:EmrB/QacA subfamily drug resistance transporter